MADKIKVDIPFGAALKFWIAGLIVNVVLVALVLMAVAAMIGG